MTWTDVIDQHIDARLLADRLVPTLSDREWQAYLYFSSGHDAVGVAKLMDVPIAEARHCWRRIVAKGKHHAT